MSSYNHEKFIGKCIESVMGQTFQDFELIIFDDCSTDKTYEIAKEYQNEKIKIYKSPYNRGMAQNNNEAIKLAKGQYIANLNSDDFWESTKLEKQVKFLDENHNYGAVFTDVNLVNEKDKTITSKRFKYFDGISNKNRFQWLRHWLFNGNCLCFSSVLIRNEVYDKIGSYNNAYIVLLDLDMWTRVCLAGYEIGVIKEDLTNFRFLKNNQNLGRQRNRDLLNLETRNVYKNYLNIKDKKDFLKVFPEYNAKKLSNNNIDYCLMDFILVKFFSLKEKVDFKNKAMKKEFKHILLLKDSFLTDMLFNNLSQNNFNYLNKMFSLDYKKYRQIMTCTFSGEKLSQKKNLNFFLKKLNNIRVIT